MATHNKNSVLNRQVLEKIIHDKLLSPHNELGSVGPWDRLGFLQTIWFRLRSEFGLPVDVSPFGETITFATIAEVLAFHVGQGLLMKLKNDRPADDDAYEFDHYCLRAETLPAPVGSPTFTGQAVPPTPVMVPSFWVPPSAAAAAGVKMVDGHALSDFVVRQLDAEDHGGPFIYSWARSVLIGAMLARAVDHFKDQDHASSGMPLNAFFIELVLSRMVELGKLVKLKDDKPVLLGSPDFTHYRLVKSPKSDVEDADHQEKTITAHVVRTLVEMHGPLPAPLDSIIDIPMMVVRALGTWPKDQLVPTPEELQTVLCQLVTEGFLIIDGQGRYVLPGIAHVSVKPEPGDRRCDPLVNHVLNTIARIHGKMHHDIDQVIDMLAVVTAVLSTCPEGVDEPDAATLEAAFCNLVSAGYLKTDMFDRYILPKKNPT